MTNHIESEVLSEGLMTIYYIDYFGLSEGFMTNHIDYFGLSEGFMTNHIDYFGLSEGFTTIPMITTDFRRFPWMIETVIIIFVFKGIQCNPTIEYFGLSVGFMTNHIEYFGLSEGSPTVPVNTSDSPRE